MFVNGDITYGYGTDNGRSRLCTEVRGPGGLSTPYGGGGDKQRQQGPYGICLYGGDQPHGWPMRREARWGQTCKMRAAVIDRQWCGGDTLGPRCVGVPVSLSWGRCLTTRGQRQVDRERAAARRPLAAVRTLIFIPGPAPALAIFIFPRLYQSPSKPDRGQCDLELGISRLGGQLCLSEFTKNPPLIPSTSHFSLRATAHFFCRERHPQQPASFTGFCDFLRLLYTPPSICPPTSPTYSKR